MKVVVDTNVLYAAFVSAEGTCARVLAFLIEARCLILSQYILDELREHLSARPLFSPGLIDRQLDFLRSASEMVLPVQIAEDACNDPDDLPILGTGLAAKADFLITGDKALLVLKAFSGQRILSPRAFLDLLPPAPGLTGQ